MIPWAISHFLVFVFDALTAKRAYFVAGITDGTLYLQNQGLADVFVARITDDGNFTVWGQNGTSESDEVQGAIYAGNKQHNMKILYLLRIDSCVFVLFTVSSTGNNYVAKFCNQTGSIIQQISLYLILHFVF